MKTKNSKKVLALILSFFMILTVLPFNVMADETGNGAGTTPGTETPAVPGTTPADPGTTPEQKLAAAKKAADAALEKEASDKKTEIANLDKEKFDVDKSNAAVDKALTDAKNAVDKAAKAADATEAAINAARDSGVDSIKKVEPVKKEAPAPETHKVTYVVKGLEEGATKTFAEQQVESGKTVTLPTDTAVEHYKFKGFFEDDQGTKAFKAEKPITEATTIYAIYEKETPAKKQLSVSANVYYDAITGKVTDKNGVAVAGATVSVFDRTTKTDIYGMFSFDMTKESGNYYCGYYGYYWKDYPYNSYKLTTNTGSYFGSNGSYARYYFLVDGYGNIVDSVYAAANSSFTLHGESNKVYTVYYSDYGYGYGYGYPYYDKYYNRYYNPTTSWAKDQKLTASKTDYKEASVTLGYVTNNSWLYTTCYEYGYKYYYGYDRVIYPSQLSLSGNGTIVSGKVGVSYLPIYVYRNGVFLGSGNADVNGYFSIGLNSRVSSTSDLTFYAYGKGQVAPEKKSEKADHGVIPVKSTVVIGSTKLIKNINGVEADVNMDVAPFIKDGRTMLPLRYIAEALGFKVDWDRATRTVTLTDKEFKVQIPVETNKIIVNGSIYYSDANPVLRNGRTMLPVANIARALGLKDGTDILWDANTRVATITRLVKY